MFFFLPLSHFQGQFIVCLNIKCQHSLIPCCDQCNQAIEYQACHQQIQHKTTIVVTQINRWAAIPIINKYNLDVKNS